MEKTVYILGAGFSMSAGAPSQAKIITEIYNLKNSTYKGKQKKEIDNWIEKFDQFLKNALCVTDPQKNYYTLEDIYTPMDRAINENSSFRGYTGKELFELRDNFNKLIILAVRNAIENGKEGKESIEKFASHIVSLSKARLKNEKNDSVAVITTNWDIMLDNFTHAAIQNEPKPVGLDFSGVVDYCCYISSLDQHDESIKPGLYAIGKGRYNVKILKLHGSLNWLQCPKCQRLYVKFYKRWNGGYIFGKMYCRHCEANFRIKNEKSNLLSTNLIMPTFIKNLNNIQNKLIWQNAGIELSEASKIVFLGYSLPQADFEFKQLLSKMIRKDAKIEAILIPSDDPEDGSYSDNNLKYLTAGYRYQNFFSGRDLKMYYCGVDDYIKNNCK